VADQSAQDRLREGIEAARRGDKLTARRLLQQVLLQDRTNEAALMWMASVLDTVAERRAYLERALQVNPKNERAREALARLGGASSTAAVESRSDTRQRSGANPYLIAAGVVAVLMIIIIAAVLVTSQPAPETSIPTEFAAVMNPTFTSSLEIVPTATFFGIVVTLDASLVDLPPTFTPTRTPTPTPTLEPSATPLAVQDFAFLYSDFDGGAQPSLFLAEGGDEESLSTEGGFSDIAISPDGSQIAFVRILTDGAAPTEGGASGEGAATAEPTAVGMPQLFVAPLSGLAEAAQLTSMTGSSLTYPSWSADGDQIVFSSNEDGDEELYRISSGGGEVERLTNNQAVDTSPKFSPDGELIVYTSDLDSPGFSEIYTLSAADGTITRLTDDQGNNYSPAWSPDGTHIAYLSDKNGDGDIYVMGADGSRSMQLTPDDRDAEDRSPVWSPDGRWVAFASNRDGQNFRWYAVNAATGEVVTLTENSRSAQSLVFQPR
jgi:Tol biopolymer transport system component